MPGRAAQRSARARHYAGMNLAELERMGNQSAWLRALARRLVGPAAAEDLAQDTLAQPGEHGPSQERVRFQARPIPR